MNELISIIIPVNNGTNYLAEAINAINQQEMNVEIIVIDDGSTDNTAEFAKNCGAIVYSIPHSGLSAARNVGLKNMKGEYVLFLDHDDLMTDGALNTLYQEFTKDNDLQLVTAKLKDFISPELSETDKKQLVPREETYGGLLTGAMLFRKDVLKIVGTFDENLQTGQGVDFLLRVEANNIKTLKLDFVSSMRRIHNTNMGRTMQKQEFNDYASILRAKLAKK